jgi:hypothetical protein
VYPPCPNFILKASSTFPTQHNACLELFASSGSAAVKVQNKSRTYCVENTILLYVSERRNTGKVLLLNEPESVHFVILTCSSAGEFAILLPPPKASSGCCSSQRNCADCGVSSRKEGSEQPPPGCVSSIRGDVGVSGFVRYVETEA